MLTHSASILAHLQHTYAMTFPILTQLETTPKQPTDAKLENDTLINYPPRRPVLLSTIAPGYSNIHHIR